MVGRLSTPPACSDASAHSICICFVQFATRPSALPSAAAPACWSAPLHVQGGDFTRGDGTGGESIYGEKFAVRILLTGCATAWRRALHAPWWEPQCKKPFGVRFQSSGRS